MSELRMRFPGGRVKALTLSYDDGVEQDARLIRIMNRHGLKGTFNLNGGLFAPEEKEWPEGQIHRRLSKRAAVALYGQSGQEIALHALYHGDLPLLPPSHAIWQVMRDKEELEETFQCIVSGMAYPYGTISAGLATTLKGCGMAYARTVESTHGFDIPAEWLAWPATCHHNDAQLMELAERFVQEKPYRPKLFYLWGHSYEFEANDNWDVIERFAEYIGGREDIWYATNQEICFYVSAWRGMRTSANGKRLYNPGMTELYLSYDERNYVIHPGETLNLP